jgi:transcriptional regulator with XRE-family HTH domain
MFAYDILMKSNLTHDESVAHANLRKIWDRKKRSLGLTQEKAGELLGCSTANVGHYLTGNQPLNIRKILDFAKLLDVDPTEIDPRMADLAPTLSDSELTLIRLYRRLVEKEKSRVLDYAVQLMLSED